MSVIDQAPPMSKNAARRAAKSAARIVARQTITVLCERFPLAFMPTGEPKKPLKIGIFDDLLAACPDIEPARIKIAMEDYCHGPRYLIEQVEGAMRVGLDGQATGAVTTHQQEGADSRLARYRHLPGDVCAKLLQRVEKGC